MTSAMPSPEAWPGSDPLPEPDATAESTEPDPAVDDPDLEPLPPLPEEDPPVPDPATRPYDPENRSRSIPTSRRAARPTRSSHRRCADPVR